MKTSQIVWLWLVLVNTSLANQEATRSVEVLVQKSMLVVEGVITNIKDLSTEEVKGVGAPYLIRRRRATMKVDKTFKGELTSDEIKSGTIIIAFKQVDDPRYKGDKVPALKEGERYFVFI